MKDLKEQIIEAVQDATDTVDGTVSIPILDHFLDGILSEQLRQPAVSGFVAIAKRKYKSKDGSIQEGILIAGKWYAPRKDL
jgi:hypothetical protein